MRRVVVIGCGGAGKTVVARELAARLGLPLIHLDAENYDQEWRPVDREVFAARQRDLVAGPAWVIDGNYAGTLPIRLVAADTLVFLDLPARVCLLGILERRLRYGGGQHADGVFDRVSWEFLRYVWTYRRRVRPQVRRLMAEHGGHLVPVVLTSRRQVDHWLRTAARDQVASRGPAAHVSRRGDDE